MLFESYHGHQDREGKNEYRGSRENVSKVIMDNLKKIGIYDSEHDLYKIDIKELNCFLVIYCGENRSLDFHYFTDEGPQELETDEGFEILIGYIEDDYQYIMKNFK